MFSYEFSVIGGSLLANEARLTKSYLFEIDNYGNVVNARFPKTITTNSKRLSYKEANKILENGTKNEKLQETMNNLRDVGNLFDLR